ncbi:MAG: hypothetical protein JNK48_08395 [Bryobacterales bacterium]|nr:hypothetical protein [Bryobacterales bacterium]
MTTSKPVVPVFRQGDEVVLVAGNNEGMTGVFLKLRPDTNWADVADRNGNVRSHPVVWLARANPAAAPNKES